MDNNNAHQSGGGLAALARRMQTLGRDGDSILAHINPEEARQLMQMGGRGTINPATGLPEFATWENFDANLYASRNPGVVQKYGTQKTDLWNHYTDFGRLEGRVGNAAQVAAREAGYAGVFGVDPDTGETYDPSGGYRQFKLDDDLIQDIPGRSYGLYEDRVPGSYITAHGGRVIEDSARNTALHEGLIDQFGYGGDFGTGGFNAFTRVQNADTRDAIANYIQNFRDTYDESGAAPGAAPPALSGYNAAGTAQLPVYTPQPMPMWGGVNVPGGIESVGVSRSPVTGGDIMRPVNYSPAVTSFDAAMQAQGVGTRYYIMVMAEDGTLTKKYVPSTVAGAQREYVGVYGTRTPEHSFYPSEDFSVADELDVKGLLGLT